MNTHDLVVGESLFALFKGEPGTGKSIAAHSFPKPTYTFDLDRKMTSIKNYYPDEDFEYDNFSSLIALNQRLEELQRRCDYKTLIFDSITSLSTLAMQCMVKHRNPGSASRTVRAGVPGYEVEDYGGETNEMNIVMDLLKSIHIMFKVNVIVCAHVLVVEHQAVGGKVTNISRTLVTAGKKAAVIIPSGFDEMYHFDVEPSFDPNQEYPEYIVHTRHAGQDSARTSLDVPAKISWAKQRFYDKLKKYIDKDISA